MKKESMQRNSVKTAEIEAYFCKKEWTQSECIALLKIIEKELEESPDSAWLLAQMSCIYYELKQYKKSMQIINKALSISPSDPLYLWYYAGTLDMLNKKAQAIATYKRIMKMGIYKIGCIETNEGTRWAKSLINDCRYRLGLCYSDINKKLLAIKWIKEHLNNRRPGLRSIYNIKDVKKKLAEIV